jgi:hypothetical protein
MISQIILGLLTIAMSGVIAAVVTYRLNISRDERRFRRQRLEEVFTAFNGFTRQLGVTWLTYTNVMTGKIDYNQALDMVIAQGKDVVHHFDTLNMIILLYWPELIPHLDRVKAMRDEANDVLHEHKRRYLAGHAQDKISFDAISVLTKQLDTLEQEFSAAARGAAQRLRGAG